VTPFTTTRWCPLGRALELSTNSPAVLRAAEESWSCFGREQNGAAQVRLRVTVSNDDDGVPPPPAVYRAGFNLMAMVSDARNFALCDLEDGAAFAALGGEAVRDRDWLRYFFLDAMAFLLLDSVWFTPVHGACVALDGCGVLLCGDSHAGKSSLAFACARRGWTFIADDASHIERGSNIAVGNRHLLRLREPARELFPELRGAKAALRANGKTAVELRTADLPGVVTAPSAAAEHIVFLRRETGALELRAFPRAWAMEQMLSVLEFSEGELLDTHRRALETLLQRNVWELRYAGLDDAVDRLAELVREGN
jgi:hypothetical protein